eukprot:8143314-Pyramimonas_sp.AAC.1
MTNAMTIIDDKGRPIELGFTFPALLAIHCREALLRSLDRDLGDKWADEGRLCLDVPRAALVSNKFSARGKGLIRALACNAIWTPGRAIRCGYDISDVCPFCGDRDSLHHRLWVCSHCADVRAEVADADAADYSANFFCHAALAHPADILPRPCVDGQVQFKWFRDELDGPEGPEDVQDGAIWPLILGRELARASWAITVHDTAGELLGAVSGPVWDRYPQTPQAGEWLARGMAGALVRHESSVYSDSLNVVRLSNLPLPARLS